MDQIVDRRETATCAKWTLGGLARTGALLAAAALASVLMVDLPIPMSGAADGQGVAQPYVPASDKWIELGTPQRPEASSRADMPPSSLLPDLLHGTVAS